MFLITTSIQEISYCILPCTIKQAESDTDPEMSISAWQSHYDHLSIEISFPNSVQLMMPTLPSKFPNGIHQSNNNRRPTLVSRWLLVKTFLRWNEFKLLAIHFRSRPLPLPPLIEIHLSSLWPGKNYHSALVSIEMQKVPRLFSPVREVMDTGSVSSTISAAAAAAAEEWKRYKTNPMLQWRDVNFGCQTSPQTPHFPILHWMDKWHRSFSARD